MGVRKNECAGKTKNREMILILTGALVALCPFRKRKIFIHKLTKKFKLCFVHVPMKYKSKKKEERIKND